MSSEDWSILMMRSLHAKSNQVHDPKEARTIEQHICLGLDCPSRRSECLAWIQSLDCLLLSLSDIVVFEDEQLSPHSLFVSKEEERSAPCQDAVKDSRQVVRSFRATGSEVGCQL